MIERIAVIGAGAWGTAFAKVLADAGRQVTLYSRRRQLAEAISTSRENSDYLPGVLLPEHIRATSDLDECLLGAEAAVLAMPSQTLRENLTVVRDLLPDTGPVVSLAKGVEIGTGLRMSQVVAQVGHVPAERIVVVTGPNLAKEIAAGQPTATVMACVDPAMAGRVAAASATSYFRPYTITDVAGAEIAGTGKNVIALAVGIADGLNHGGNTAASLMARGLAELTALGVALGARAETFAGLAGLGDLIATCSSPLSRNRSLGRRLGSGMAIADALAAGGGQVAEGVVSCRALRDTARRHGIDMPITDGVFRVCYLGMPPQEMVRALMDGPWGAE